MTSPSKRREIDLMKLISKFEVETVNDKMDEFFVFFHGPADSLYEGGVWKIRVMLYEDYPFSPPWIMFINKLYHPNVNEEQGYVCVDVLKQCWSPMFDLVNVFEQFLPQLLLCPNPEDPLNFGAAGLMTDHPALYEERVREYCQKYARPEDVGRVHPQPDADPVDPQPDAGPVDPQPDADADADADAPSSKTEDEHDDSSEKPDADAPSSKTEDEHDSSEKPDADAPSKTEDEEDSSEKPDADAPSSKTEDEDESSDKPDADGPSKTENEDGEPDAGPVDPETLLSSQTEGLSLE